MCKQTRLAGALGPEGRVTPEGIITRAPTAELRANDGDLSLGQIRTVRELVRRMSGRVEAPGWFE